MKTMEEKINVEFTGEQMDFILKYQEDCGAETVQDAIMTAIAVAFDRKMWADDNWMLAVKWADEEMRWNNLKRMTDFAESICQNVKKQDAMDV